MMERLVRYVAPRGPFDFALRVAVFLVAGNLFAMGVVYASHGFFPSGLNGQLIETTIIALPFAVFFLAIIRYLRNLQEELLRIATTDLLTGLPNRRAFLTDVTTALNSAVSGHIVLADADHFKMVNDTFGHDVGDICLISIGDHLRRNIEGTGLLSRFGGEEFAIFLPHGAGQSVSEVGQAVCGPIPYSHGTQVQGAITLSAGVATVQGADNLKAALAAADKALYLAKAQGRSRYVLAEPSHYLTSFVPTL